MTDMYFKVIWNSLFLVFSEIPPPHNNNNNSLPLNSSFETIHQRKRQLHRTSKLCRKYFVSRDYYPRIFLFIIHFSFPLTSVSQPTALNIISTLLALFPDFEHLLQSCHSQDPNARQWLLFQHVHVVRAAASRNESRVPMVMFGATANCV